MTSCAFKVLVWVWGPGAARGVRRDSSARRVLAPTGPLQDLGGHACSHGGHIWRAAHAGGQGRAAVVAAASHRWAYGSCYWRAKMGANTHMRSHVPHWQSYRAGGPGACSSMTFGHTKRCQEQCKALGAASWQCTAHKAYPLGSWYKEFTFPQGPQLALPR